MCDGTFSIAQFGSTRSINASAAAAIAMHAWIGRYADLDTAWRGGLRSKRSAGRLGRQAADEPVAGLPPGTLGGCQNPPKAPISSLHRLRATGV